MSNVQVAEGLEGVVRARPRPSRLGYWLGIARRKPLGAAGGAVMLVFIVIALIAPVMTPYDPYQVNMSVRLSPPDFEHPFGTDQSGRDLLSRIMAGASVSMFIGVAGSMLSIIISSFMGTFSAYRGGRVDLIVQRFVDAFQALPTLALLLAASFVLSRGPVTLLLLIGTLFGIRSSRVVRGAALSVIQNEYVTGARAIGATDWWILTRYIMPNVFAPIMVLVTIQLGAIISSEASLSFLNLGIPPPTVTWGQMLALTSLPYMMEAPWIALAPGLALTSVIWGINILGDALRDVLDPRLRGGAGGG